MFESPAVGLLVAAILVLANAFFVASEFAIVKIRPTRLEALAEYWATPAPSWGGHRAPLTSAAHDPAAIA